MIIAVSRQAELVDQGHPDLPKTPPEPSVLEEPHIVLLDAMAFHPPNHSCFGNRRTGIRTTWPTHISDRRVTLYVHNWHSSRRLVRVLVPSVKAAHDQFVHPVAL